MTPPTADRTRRVPLTHEGGGRFSAQVPLDDSGLYSVGVRMVPEIDGLSNPLEAGLIKWA